ncbi:hypothetical protein DL766_004460 [Monosporascus sp. MC13-8B]|uniref:C2H2-type domain-containing protein n=1 Tax=Monosporascus cannonballus TaxID=155416 RepID=A0ABY0H2H3_9PEZI|nr:hypothetical protein DL762_006294 [Monosporascus cannonballus]RYP01385.1 hypothetical protein DL763_000195 [Monosporascus cannonballus]RYP31277.1 hypothetical protein DL766_004460 [Monosporascus sp. MC13-8B]
MQESQRLSDLKAWLHATSCANEQKRYSDIRSEFPGTGRWLLDNESIKEWMDPMYPTIPPLLWLNGIPGADGIDEYPRGERRKITQWFRHLVEDLEPPRQDRVRCLFVSQYDGIAQRDFGGLTAVQIKAHHTRADIHQFSMASAARIQDELGLSDDLWAKITSKIEEAADGMFLLAKLIADILGDSTSIEDIEVELQNDVLLTELKQAFLIEENHVQLPQEDLSLANFCVDYLNLEGFHNGASRERELFQNGYYALMDYAVPYWIRHLEIGLSKVEEDHELPKTLPESLEAFLDLHFLPPTKQFYVSQSNVKRLQVFENRPFYERLQTSIISARKELTFVGEMKQGELALNLSAIVRDIRSQLESIYENTTDESERIKMGQIYGADLYKGPRLSCRFFQNGFISRTQRDQHVDKHLRPFRCDVVGCPSAAMGMSSEKELKKHKKTAHDIDLDNELDFPEEQNLQQEEQQQQQTQNQEAEQAAPRRSRVPKPPKEKRPRITEYPCTHCHKVFNKKYNRDSHLVTHKNERDIPCGIYGALFAREHDRNRHETTTHAAEKEFVCGGVLEDGRRWGCDKRFTRADTLRHYYKTATGQGCRPPWFQTSELTGPERVARGAMPLQSFHACAANYITFFDEDNEDCDKLLLNLIFPGPNFSVADESDSSPPWRWEGANNNDLSAAIELNLLRSFHPKGTAYAYRKSLFFRAIASNQDKPSEIQCVGNQIKTTAYELPFNQMKHSQVPNAPEDGLVPQENDSKSTMYIVEGAADDDDDLASSVLYFKQMSQKKF